MDQHLTVDQFSHCKICFKKKVSIYSNQISIALGIRTRGKKITITSFGEGSNKSKVSWNLAMVLEDIK